MFRPRLPHPSCGALLGLLCWLAAPVFLWAADAIPVSDEYVLKTWEVDAGLPNNSIHGIAQTPDGYLWIATPGGLARFDGVRFTTFSRNDTPGLESNYVRAVFASREGDLWVGLDRGGVARRRGGGFEVIAPQAARTAATSWTSSFAQDAAGAVWFGRAPDTAAFRWCDGGLNAYASAQGVGPGADTFVSADASGVVWFATKAACGVFNGERFLPVDPPAGESVRLAPSQRGGMWAARGARLLRLYADSPPETAADLSWLSDAAAPAAAEVNVLFEDSRGDLWLGTRSAGLYRFRAGEFVHAPASGKSILAIGEDREGSLWVGTADAGLNRLRPSRFALRQAKHGLGRDSVTSMCEDGEGRLWLAVQDGAPVWSTDSSRKIFAEPAGWPGAPVTVLCRGREGDVWIGCNTATLLHWSKGVFEGIRLPEYHVRSLLADHEGGIWIATARSGLLRWCDGAVERAPTDGGLVVVRALAQDAAGHLWAGTEEGLVFRRELDGRFVPVPLPGAKPGDSIRFIVADEKDAVWIGALGGGLYRWRSGAAASLPRDAGLPTDDLRSLVIDPDESFWISTGRGLFRAERSRIESAVERRSASVAVGAYGRDDGLRSLEFVFGNRNAAVKTGDGRLWFATSRGALEIGPEAPRRNAPPLPVLIEEMQVDGRPVPLGGRITLPPHPGVVRIQYALPNPVAPERLQFRWRLEGEEQGWTSAGAQRAATFPRLPPGRYRFQVEASTDGESWRPEGASLAFAVRAAWWETKWFRALALAASASAFAWLVRFVALQRMRARLRRLERETALERERARIARDMHDELGASLTRIALMSDLAAIAPESDGPSGPRLAEIAAAARTVAGALDEIVWTVNPRNDTLERLVGYLGEFAAEYLEAAGVAVRLELPPELPALGVASDVRHEILMAVKEALNNAAKYADAAEATVRIAFAEGVLRIAIVDEGRGFDPAAVSASTNGLANMRQRIESVGGAAQIQSAPGGGTRVFFAVPLDAGRSVTRTCDMTKRPAAAPYAGARPAAGNPETP